MLNGTANLEALGERAPTVSLDPKFSLDLGKVDWLQLSYELPGDRQDLFPQGLHPTMPPIVTLQLWRSEGGDLGSFGMAQMRLSCRAGMRIRAFLIQSVIDGEAAAATLRDRFGYFATPGHVGIHRRADRIEGVVEAEGRTVLHGMMLEPHTLPVDALQHIGNMNLVRTPEGLRLLQVEPDIETLGVQRGEQRLLEFDADFWRIPSRRLRHPIIAAAAHTKITLPPIRYLQDPNQTAVKGTVAASKDHRAA